MKDHSRTASKAPPIRPAAGGLLRLAAAAVAGYRAWRRRRIAIRHLAEFDDHLLKDIGISRAEIHHVTRHGKLPRRRR